MKKIFILVSMVIFAFHAHAQTTFNWGYSLEDDHFGNYFPPLTRGELWFDIGVNGGTSATDVNNQGDLIYAAMTYSNNPVYDMSSFIVLTDTTYYFILKKFNADGTELWSKCVPNGQKDRSSIRGMAIDSEDNIILVGTYHDTIGLNDVILEHPIPGLMKGFIMKFTNEGELIFAQSTVEMDVKGVFIYDVKVDENDNIYFNTEYGVVKLDSEGNKLDSVYLAGSVKFKGFNLDDQNNIYGFGHINGQAYLGADSSFSFPQPNLNCTDGFLIKYNLGSGFQWFKQINSIAEDYATVNICDVALNNNQVILSGTLTGPSTYNFGSDEDTIRVETGRKELFIESLSQENGQHQWINQLSTDDNFAQLVVDPASEYLILASTFSDSVEVDVHGKTEKYYARVNTDLFITQIAPDGSYHSFTTIEGGSSQELVSSISLLGSRNAIVTFTALTGSIDLDPSASQYLVSCNSNTSYNSIIASYTLPEINDIITGIEAPSDKFKIYPNPASEIVRIQMDFPGLVKIYSASGVEIYSESKKEGLTEIRLPECAPGLYTVQIISEQKAETMQLLIN